MPGKVSWRELRAFRKAELDRICQNDGGQELPAAQPESLPVLPWLGVARAT